MSLIERHCKGTLRFSMVMGLVTLTFAVSQINKIKDKLEALNDREIQNSEKQAQQKSNRNSEELS